MSGVNGGIEIRAKTVVTPDRILRGGRVRLAGERIKAVDGLSPGAGGSEVDPGILIPGIIDIHINGAFGIDCSNCNSREMARLSRSLSQHGCTAFYPTLISDQVARLSQQLSRLGNLLDDTPPGAQPLGIHLEGPFLNPAQAGAHPSASLIHPSLDLAAEFVEASKGKIRLFTLAPELPGAVEFISDCPQEWALAAGHSQATYEEMNRAIGAGIRSATHVFNAMAPFSHRDPGLLVALLNHPDVFTEIIADGLHVHPAAVELLVRCKGSRRVILVTDANSAAGMPDGEYSLGALTITQRAGVCRNEKGILAGSSLLPDQGLRKLWNWLGGAGLNLPLQEVVRMTSTAPAELMKLETKGKIESGYDADLVLLDENLGVCKTWVKGRLVFEADELE